MQNGQDRYDKIMADLLEWEKSSKEECAERLKKKIAVCIKSYRILHRMTQEELAVKIGAGRIQVIRWEQRKNVPHEIFIKIMYGEGILTDKERMV